MSERLESYVEKEKYLDLAFEYNKLMVKFKQLGGLSQRILGEKEEKTSEIVKIDKKLRHLELENQNLSFRNNQLSKRILVLQEDYELLKNKVIYQSKRNSVEMSDSVSNKNIENYQSNTPLTVNTLNTVTTTINSLNFINTPNSFDKMNDGLNTFVEVTQQQVANLSNENEELVETIKRMRCEFDIKLKEKEEELKNIQKKQKNIQKKFDFSLGKNSFEKFINLPQFSFFKTVVKDEEVKCTINDTDLLKKDENDLINNENELLKMDFGFKYLKISRKLINQNEKIIFNCLNAYTELIKLLCNDILETVQNSFKSIGETFKYSEFNSAILLVENAIIDIKSYEKLPPFIQNRFHLIWKIIKKCNTALIIIYKLLCYNFEQINNDLKIFECLNQYIIYFTTIETLFQKLENDYVKNERINNNEILDIFKEMKNVLNELENYEINFDNVLNNEIDEKLHYEIYLTLISILKSRFLQINEIINMFKFIIKSEKKIVKTYGWNTFYMNQFNDGIISNNNMELICYNYTKMTNSINEINQDIQQLQFNDVQLQSLLEDDIQTPYIKSLKNNYEHLQLQLKNTYQTLDQIQNTNEILNFKIKTYSMNNKTFDTTVKFVIICFISY